MAKDVFCSICGGHDRPRVGRSAAGCNHQVKIDGKFVDICEKCYSDQQGMSREQIRDRDATWLKNVNESAGKWVPTEMVMGRHYNGR